MNDGYSRAGGGLVEKIEAMTLKLSREKKKFFFIKAIWKQTCKINMC